MVMNGEIDWRELHRRWQQRQADWLAAQQALDDAMTLYLQANGPPPTQQALKQAADLRQQMLETRSEVDACVSAHAVDLQQKANLPRHE